MTMRNKLENHPLIGRQISTVDGKPNADGNTILNIEAVYEMGIDGQNYICLLTWTPGNVPPQYRSHGQMDWENISLDLDSELGQLLNNAIETNKQQYKIL